MSQTKLSHVTLLCSFALKEKLSLFIQVSPLQNTLWRHKRNPDESMWKKEHKSPNSGKAAGLLKISITCNF